MNIPNYYQRQSSSRWAVPIFGRFHGFISCKLSLSYLRRQLKFLYSFLMTCTKAAGQTYFLVPLIYDKKDLDESYEEKTKILGCD